MEINIVSFWRFLKNPSFHKSKLTIAQKASLAIGLATLAIAVIYFWDGVLQYTINCLNLNIDLNLFSIEYLNPVDVNSFQKFLLPFCITIFIQSYILFGWVEEDINSRSIVILFSIGLSCLEMFSIDNALLKFTYFPITFLLWTYYVFGEFLQKSKLSIAKVSLIIVVIINIVSIIVNSIEINNPVIFILYIVPLAFSTLVFAFVRIILDLNYYFLTVFWFYLLKILIVVSYKYAKLLPDSIRGNFISLFTILLIAISFIYTLEFLFAIESDKKKI